MIPETAGPPGAGTAAVPGASGATRWRPAGVRLVLLAAGAVALLAGLDGALLRLGVGAPVRSDRLLSVHGVLLVLGFVATLIALERAVALGRRWGVAAPALTGLGGIALASPLPMAAPGVLLTAGTAVQAAIFVPLWRRRRDAAVLVQALGAASALGGAMLFAAGASAVAYLGWLIGFAVLLIGGERMELARLGRSGAAAENAVLACGVALLAAIVLTLLFPGWGPPLLGAALLALVVALVRVDLVRRMPHSPGLARLGAAYVLAGYAWLSVAGVLLLVAPDPLSGGAYDAVVHAVFLGFAISVIVAHAAVILPAVLRRPLPFHPLMHAPAALLHVALLVRVVGGDLLGARPAWQVGGVGDVVAVLAFALVSIGMAGATRIHHRARTADPGPSAQSSDTADPAPGPVPHAARWRRT